MSCGSKYPKDTRQRERGPVCKEHHIIIPSNLDSSDDGVKKQERKKLD